MELQNFIENRPIIFTLILAALQWLALEFICKKYPQGSKVEFKLKWAAISSLAFVICLKVLYGDRLEGDLGINVLAGLISIGFLSSLKTKTYKELVKTLVRTFLAFMEAIPEPLSEFITRLIIILGSLLIMAVIDTTLSYFFSGTLLPWAIGLAYVATFTVFLLAMEKLYK